MIKGEPKAPIMLLFVLVVLIVGIFLAAKMNDSKDEGTFQKVQQKHQLEKELYEITP